MITVDEVKDLANEFWTYVKSGQPGDGIKHLFINPGVLVPSGELMDLEKHQDLHRALCDEFHEWLTISVTPIASDPERVRVDGIAQWGASFKDGRPGRVKAKVTEYWFIERCEDEKLRWTLFASPKVEFEKDSAPLDI